MRRWNYATLWASFARRRHRCCAAAFGVVDRVAIDGETDCLTHALVVDKGWPRRPMNLF
jgi:hypothetical protein